MDIPEGFQFSQASLQAFVDCPRLFELRYLRHLSWPEVERGPGLEYERRRAAGQAFHRMVYQETVGVRPTARDQWPGSPELARWWANYLATPPPNLPEQRHPEITLTAPLHSYRLLAKFDMLAIEPEVRAVIVDWKTYRTRPDRARLSARMQTRVYMHLLAEAGHELNGGSPIAADQIEMVYWFADFPGDPEVFEYSGADDIANRTYLRDLVERIERQAATGFPSTDSASRCETCHFAPLCNRGAGGAGLGPDDWDPEMDAESELSFDFEQIAEIEY
jgi:hypothetical protein